MPQQVFTLHEEPMGAPRMTRRDVWKKRPCVVRYRAYADRLRLACRGIDKNAVGLSWTAWFSMPASWSKKKRAEMAGKVHRSKPDRDNIDKGVLDSLFESDQGVAFGHIGKFWDDGKGPRIELVVTTE